MIIGIGLRGMDERAVITYNLINGTDGSEGASCQRGRGHLAEPGRGRCRVGCIAGNNFIDGRDSSLIDWQGGDA